MLASSSPKKARHRVTYRAHRQSARRRQLRRPNHLQHQASCSLCCCPSSSPPTGSPPGHGSPGHKERRGERRSLEEEARRILGREEVRRRQRQHRHQRRRRRRGRHRSRSLHLGCQKRKDGRHTQAERGCGWEDPTRSGRSSQRSTIAAAAQTRQEPTGRARVRGRKTHSCWWQEARADARRTVPGCRTAEVVAGMEAAVRSPGAAVHSLRTAVVGAGRRAVAHRRGSAKGEGTGCHRTGPEEDSLQHIRSALSQEEPRRAAHNGALNGGEREACTDLGRDTAGLDP